jgi:hypothetical protein
LVSNTWPDFETEHSGKIGMLSPVSATSPVVAVSPCIGMAASYDDL